MRILRETVLKALLEDKADSIHCSPLTYQAIHFTAEGYQGGQE